MKQCGMCGLRKQDSHEFFAWKNRDKETLQSHCRECQKIYRRQHYLRNRQKYIDKAQRNTRLAVERLIPTFLDYLGCHPCVDCGECDIIVLEFDHLDPESKVKEVGTMVQGGYSWEKIQEEIDKCEVVCCNCHRRRTASRANWRRYAIVGQLAVRHSSKVD